MDKKTPVAHLENVPEQKRFRVDAMDLYLSGDVSGKRAERLFHHAELAGTAHVSDLGKSEGSKNSHQDLLRKALQNSLWPKPYETEVRGWNPKSGTVEPMKVAYYLRHKMIHAMLLVNEAEDILALQEKTLSSRVDLREHLREFRNQFRLTEVLALGLWMDGVPFNHDRTQSLECISMNLPGLPKEYQDLRQPVTCFPKFFHEKGETWESVLQPIVWSMRCLLFGRFPRQRHDDTPFTDADAARRKLAGTAIDLKCCLAEIRGDWSMFKEVLHFPDGKARVPFVFSALALWQVCTMLGRMQHGGRCREAATTFFDINKSIIPSNSSAGGLSCGGGPPWLQEDSPVEEGSFDPSSSFYLYTFL